MKIFRKWWKRSLEIEGWSHGVKHPDTHPVIFKNVWGWDLVRRVLKERCHECGYVVADVGIDVREIMYCCDHPDCDCVRTGNSRMHQLCGACYTIYHSLYINYGLKNKEFFRAAHNEEKQERRDGRNRMGI